MILQNSKSPQILIIRDGIKTKNKYIQNNRNENNEKIMRQKRQEKYIFKKINI